MINILKSFSLIFFFLFGTLSFARSPIEVTAKLTESINHEIEISFSLKNLTGKPITVLRDDLPWGMPHSTLIIISESTGVLLDPSIPLIQSNPGDWVTLKPGAEVTGKFTLQDFFSDFEKLRKKRELVIFWSYRPGYSFTDAVGKQPRFGGWFCVGKTL